MADVKFFAEAKTLEKLFEECAMAMFKVMTEGTILKNKIFKNINVHGKTNEELLYNFLEEFIFLLDSENFMANKIDNLKINNNTIEAKISGDYANNYIFSNSVKAVTFNEMKIKHNKDVWNTTCILDV
jgi:SHS2 domain-containing protein